MIRHAGLSVSLLTMDHPGQRIPGHSCHEQREQRVPGHPVGHGFLPLANVPLSLRVAFACLTDIAAALVVCALGCPGHTVTYIKQGFPHLIQTVLGWALLRLALLDCADGAVLRPSRAASDRDQVAVTYLVIPTSDRKPQL